MRMSYGGRWVRRGGRIIVFGELGEAPLVCPSRPSACTWIAATNADVARDGTLARYRSLLATPVGTQVQETYNGRLWRLRVVSKATDPGLTTFAKDVRGWICRWNPSDGPLDAEGPVDDPRCPPRNPPWHITGGRILIAGDHGGPMPQRFALPHSPDADRFTLTLSGRLIPRGIKGGTVAGMDHITRFTASILRPGPGPARTTVIDGGREQNVNLRPDQNQNDVSFVFQWNVNADLKPRWLTLDMYSSETITCAASGAACKPASASDCCSGACIDGTCALCVDERKANCAQPLPRLDVTYSLDAT